MEYAVLEEKAAAATAHHNELSAKIKAAEKRMAEIAVLRTHIINMPRPARPMWPIGRLVTPRNFARNTRKKSASSGGKKCL